MVLQCKSARRDVSATLCTTQCTNAFAFSLPLLPSPVSGMFYFIRGDPRIVQRAQYNTREAQQPLDQSRQQQPLQR